MNHCLLPPPVELFAKSARIFAPGEFVGQQRGIHIPDRLSKPSPVAIPVLRRPEQELPVMAAVGQMVNLSRQDVAIRPGHACGFSDRLETLRPRKEASKLTHVPGWSCSIDLNALPLNLFLWSDQNGTGRMEPLKGLGIEGVTLHSYRYAWAERARKAHYPRRQAEEALGHNSKAVHFAYAKRAQVTVDSLEAYEELAAKNATNNTAASTKPI